MDKYIYGAQLVHDLPQSDADREQVWQFAKAAKRRGYDGIHAEIIGNSWVGTEAKKVNTNSAAA